MHEAEGYGGFALVESTQEERDGRAGGKGYRRELLRELPQH